MAEQIAVWPRPVPVLAFAAVGPRYRSKDLHVDPADTMGEMKAWFMCKLTTRPPMARVLYWT